MGNKCSEFIKWAINNGWKLIEKESISLNLKENITSRYKDIPHAYIEFLSRVKCLISPSEKTWFLCEDEYNNETEIPFKWNEFELISIEATENDKDWKVEIISWWDKKLPIVMSVGDGYAFYAIDLNISTGSIVKGEEPEFEEVEKVADNIDDFLDLIMLNEIILE